MAGHLALGKERVEKRLQELLESGLEEKVYEALQLYTSKASRRSSAGDYDGAVRVASEGAVTLVEQGSPEGGLELGNLIMKIATDHETQYGDTKAAIMRVDSAFASGDYRSFLTHRKQLLKNALSWSIRTGERAHGDKELNLVYGELLWDAGELEQAVGRLVAAEEPDGLASRALETLSSSSSSSNECRQIERLMTLAILSFVAIENLRDANRLYDALRSQLTKQQPTSALLPFCGYLLPTCERDAGPLFELLMKVFAQALDIEPKLKQILAEIGHKYFRIPKPASLSNLLEGMMGMFG